ncbi:hypothetical protein DEO72_LG5g2369 [Vigna unguiculata]|uniref:Transposase (putative) gypsy type domain-containing protein n=1 Tax=Vigna unguiculata TaxID=3917 RepID=A0A4D6M271_VIGUN|nr:hypothetical protein DEO72_LG5g2369 [Vigna unguiculata]
MVSIGLGFHFGGKRFSRLGSWTINMGLKAAEGLLGSFASFEIRDPVCLVAIAHRYLRLVVVRVLSRIGVEMTGFVERVGVSGDIVSLERVSAIDRVCHGQEGATEKFFYMYMCHFSQLHIRLPFDDFTMGVLRALNVAPTQLHPNSWAYLQAFRILCESLYLEPSPYAFLYFYDTRPRRPATWLSLISRPSISRLDAFSQSFKHFKDGYFKVVVKEGGEPYFLNADGSTKFPFSWTNNPSRYKDMGVEELSSGDKEVVGMLLRFVDKLPTKGLVRVYNSVHPIIDIEGHMAQSGKKNLALFQALRKEMAAKAKEAGKTGVPNLQESVVEVHVHGGTKRRAELPPRPGKGKDVKRVRAAILGSGDGAGSASGEKLPEAGLIELPEICVRKDISINLPDTVVNSIDNMEVDHIVRTMVEFGSKALVLGRRVGSLYRREVKEAGELQGKVDKLAEEKAALEKEKEGWEAERKRLVSWKVRCLDSEEKLNKRIGELEEDYEDLKDKYDGAVGELDDLKNSVIQEHINGFEKGLRQAAFFYKDVDALDSRFDVDKDVVGGKLVGEDEEGGEEVGNEAAEAEKDVDAPVEDDKAA